jgi:ABC-type glycerol-3-phosphate transport system substrate-binding protein
MQQPEVRMVRIWGSRLAGATVALLLAVLIPGTARPAGTVQLKFTTLSDPYPQYMNKLITVFERDNPGVQVAVEGIPFNQYFDVIEARLASGASDPDVLFVDQPLVMAYTARGFLTPLDQYVDMQEQRAFVPALVEAGKVNGKLMAIPLQSSTQLLYYNITLFQKAGIPLPSDDPAKRLTWEQLVEVARKLTGPNQWGFAFEQVDRPYQLLPLPESLGGQPIDPSGTRATGYIDTPPWIRAATFYWDLYNRWKVSPPGVTFPQTDDLFESGRLAMLLGIELQVNRFAKDKDLKWGIAPHPYFAGHRVVTPTGSWYVGINKNTRQLEAAGRWIHFLASEGAGRMWYEVSGRLPVHRRVLSEMQNLATSPIAKAAARIAYYESTHTAVPRPHIVGYREWEDILFHAFADIRNGADPAKTLQNAATRIDQALQKYR